MPSVAINSTGLTLCQLDRSDIPAMASVIATRTKVMSKSTFNPTEYAASLPLLFSQGFQYFGVFDNGVLDGFHQFAFPTDPISGLPCALGDINVTRANPARAKNASGFSVNNTALFNYLTTELEAHHIYCWWLVYPVTFNPPLVSNKEDLRSNGVYTRNVMAVVPANQLYAGDHADFVKQWLIRSPFQEDVNVIRLIKAGHENDKATP